MELPDPPVLPPRAFSSAMPPPTLAPSSPIFTPPTSVTPTHHSSPSPDSTSTKPLPSTGANYSPSLNRAAIQTHIGTITTALQSLPRDHPSVTAHLLTRCTLYLTLHHASKPPPNTSTSFAQGALRDARQLVHTVPHLPSAWLTLFSACLAVARPADADLALRAASRFCPFDPALRLTARAFRPYNPPSRTVSDAHAAVVTSQSSFSSSTTDRPPLVATSPSSPRLSDPSHLSSQAPSSVPPPPPPPPPRLSPDLILSPHAQRRGIRRATTRNTRRPIRGSSSDPTAMLAMSPVEDIASQTLPNDADVLTLSKPSFKNRIHPPVHAHAHVQQALKEAEDALLLDAHDDAISHYVQVLVSRPHAPPLPPDLLIRALSGRSDAWMGKWRRDGDDVSFSNALADARLLISNFPSKDCGWLRLGNAYLAHGSPDRAHYIFSRALTHCPDSKPLADAVADSGRFIPTHDTIPSNADNGHNSCNSLAPNAPTEAESPDAILERNYRVGTSQDSDFKDRDTVPPMPSTFLKSLDGQNWNEPDVSLDSNNSSIADRPSSVRSDDNAVSVDLSDELSPSKVPRENAFLSNQSRSSSRDSLLVQDPRPAVYPMTDTQRKEAQWQEAVLREHRKREVVKTREHLRAGRKEVERLSAHYSKKVARMISTSRGGPRVKDEAHDVPDSHITPMPPASNSPLPSELPCLESNPCDDERSMVEEQLRVTKMSTNADPQSRRPPQINISTRERFGGDVFITGLDEDEGADLVDHQVHASIEVDGINDNLNVNGKLEAEPVLSTYNSLPSDSPSFLAGDNSTGQSPDDIQTHVGDTAWSSFSNRGNGSHTSTLRHEEQRIFNGSNSRRTHATSTKSSLDKSGNSRSSLGYSSSSAPQKLYDMLQVPRDATEGQIKRSYYVLARKYHPDKNANDSQSKAKFQQLAEAYRVLSDPESRAVYDRYGDRGLVKNSVDVIDPSTLFAMVFGSDQFVHLIGELQLASLAGNVDESGNTPTEVIMEQIQRARVGKLVLEMVKSLKPWVDGDKKGFLQAAHKQMKELRETSFGPSLLHTVGNVYVQQTTYLLDKTRPFNLSAVMRKATLRSHKMAVQHKATSAASRVMDKQRKLHDRVMRTGKDNRFISEDEAKNIAVEMAENAIDMMWKISVIDIETTLEDVVMIVLSGRDLIAEGESFTSLDTSDGGSMSGLEKLSGKNRRRLGSHLGKDRRDRGGSRDGGGSCDRPEMGLSRPLPPLSHGDAASSRQEILSERAYGIQAMGRVFMSAAR